MDEANSEERSKDMRKFWMENWLSTIIGAIVLITIGVTGWTWNRHIDDMDRRFQEQHQALIKEIDARKEGDEVLDVKIDKKLDRREYLEDLTEAKEFRKEMRTDIKELLKRKS